jgi:hypothetical protein
MNADQPSCHVSVNSLYWGDRHPHTTSIWVIKSCSVWSLVTVPMGAQALVSCSLTASFYGPTLRWKTHRLPHCGWSPWVTWQGLGGLSAWWLLQILVEACCWAVSWLWVETVRPPSVGDVHSSFSVLWWCYHVLLLLEHYVRCWQLASAEWWLDVLFSAGVQDVDATHFGVFTTIMLNPAFPLNVIQASTAANCTSNSWCVAFRLCQVISTFHHVTCISLLNSLFWDCWLTTALTPLNCWCGVSFIISLNSLSSALMVLVSHLCHSGLALISVLALLGWHMCPFCVLLSWCLVLGFHSTCITPPELLVMLDPSSVPLLAQVVMTISIGCNERLMQARWYHPRPLSCSTPVTLCDL